MRFAGRPGRPGGFGGMRFGGPGSGGPGFGAPRVTPWVKRLLIANAAIFLVTVLVGFDPMADLFAFSPGRFLQRPWGMVTYMFVHHGLFHLLMNLLFVFFFGPPLEERWGSNVFIRFYMICGLAGALLSLVFSTVPIVGASAACYGLTLSFAMIWPNVQAYVWGLVPVRMKWIAGFMVALSLVSAIGPERDGVAHLAHLGGAAAGFLLMRFAGLGELGSSGASQSGNRRRRAPSGRAAAKGGRRTGRGIRPVPLWKGAGRIGRWRTRGTRKGESPVQPIDLARRKPPPTGRAAHEELDRVDAVLDKISARGIHSLTAEERALLDRVSRRTRAN